ncbi:MAG TPA: hydantoinase B/oxoprolinase family protein [Xanthobacteraceae bacterium]|nr:hydantoinase B/oxoprolinase family protein [Xanthobacteraceae bacterium]
MKLDPVTLEIMATKVAAVSEEMGYTLQRTGRTLYVKETADFGTALAARNGKFFSYPNAIGVSGFVDLDCMPTIAAVGGLEEGDVVITNNPYRSAGLATHTPDLHVIRPIHVEGVLVCYAWAFLHSSDVGGRVPSSISPSNTEIYQEGLLLPPTKLVRRGAPCEDVFGIIAANSRTPDENVGDIKAMLAALAYAERRVHEIVAQHGVAAFLDCQADLFEYSRVKARAAFRRIRDGDYAFWDWLDDDLVTPYPRRIRVRITAADGVLVLDFDGTDPQSLSAFNVPTLGTRHPWLSLRLVSLALTLDPTIPVNAGILDNITVRAPEGSILNPRFPAATGVRHATAIRVDNVLTGALAQALPETMPAASGGIVIPIVFAENDPDTGASNVIVVEPAVGGMGARFGHDGVDGRDASIANLANNPIETLEGNASLHIVEYALRPDSGGAGQWRGGNGVAITFEILADQATILGRGMERFRFRPWGLAGGCAGAPARTLLNAGTPDEKDLGKIDAVTVKRGDRFTILTPGAGGYGNPFARDAERVADDVAKGFVSRAAAATRYGVALDADGNVDAKQTARLRAAPSAPDADMLRASFEQVFPDADVTALNRRLYGLPPGPANHRRSTIFAKVLEGRDPAALPALTDAQRAMMRATFARLVADAVARE